MDDLFRDVSNMRFRNALQPQDFLRSGAYSISLAEHEARIKNEVLTKKKPKMSAMDGFQKLFRLKPNEPSPAKPFPSSSPSEEHKQNNPSAGKEQHIHLSEHPTLDSPHLFLNPRSPLREQFLESHNAPQNELPSS
jgi:hypothetical protein